MRQSDHAVRLAAFRFLEEQVRLSGEDGSIRRSVLQRGFVLDGERVPLLGPQGIFKPRVLEAIPLSITTVPVVEGESRPYDDAFGPDGMLRYRYRGTDPSHHDHAAFDRYLIGIRPDCVVEVRRDVLDETDGPMLIHGLQGFHGTSLLLPRIPAHRPDPALLEARYERFRQAG